MRTVCRGRRGDRLFRARAVSAPGPRHPARTERRTNCRLSEYNQFELDQIVETLIIFPVRRSGVAPGSVRWRAYFCQWDGRSGTGVERLRRGLLPRVESL